MITRWKSLTSSGHGCSSRRSLDRRLEETLQSRSLPTTDGSEAQRHGYAALQRPGWRLRSHSGPGDRRCCAQVAVRRVSRSPVFGVTPPTWNFTQLDDRLQGFLALVENHYRYYQFYANMAVAITAAYSAKLISEKSNLCQPSWRHAGFILLEIVFLAGSRDSLRKYYRRVEQLLPDPKHERNPCHDERFPSDKAGTRPKDRREGYSERPESSRE